MKTEKQIRKKLKQLINKPSDWFCNPEGTDRDYETIRVLKWVLKSSDPRVKP